MSSPASCPRSDRPTARATGPTHAAPRILLVESDDFTRDALTLGLQSRGFQVESQWSTRSFREVFDKVDPDILVIDLRFADGPDGVVVVQEAGASKASSVVFLADSAELDERLEAFAAGGADVLTKPFSIAEFLARVEAIHGRIRSRRDRQTIDGVLIDEDAHVVLRDGHEVRLTPTEFSLLATLWSHAGHVLSKTQLLDLVWGFEHYSQNVVEVHIRSIRRKLEAFGPRQIHTVQGAGYIFRPASEGDSCVRLAMR